MVAFDRTAVSTFDRVAADLTHGAFPELAAAIHSRSDHIIKHWRDLSLKAMPHLDRLTLEEFEDTIDIILSAAADALQSSDPRHLRGVIDSGPQHGIDRFVQEVSLLDLFEEVRILRGVVVLEIGGEMKRPLGIDEAASFHAIFDIIIQLGVMALVEKQHEHQATSLKLNEHLLTESAHQNELLAQSQKTTMEINEQLIISSVRNNELLEQAEKAEHALRASEERYRNLFDLGPVAIYSIDSSGVIVNFNRQAAKLWGREPTLGDTNERFCGSSRMFRPDGTIMPHDQCPMAEVVSGKISEMRDGEVVIERADGSRVTVLVNILPLKNPSGEVTGAVNCFYDISDRKRAEADTARLAAIVASSDDAIISKDLDGVIITWNRGAENLFGYAAKEVIGRPVTMLIPDDLVATEAQILARIRCGESIEHYETVRRRKDGFLIDISLTVSPIRNAAGRIIAASSVARDIRARVAMEKRLKEQAEDLAGESRRKDEFLAMLSHELRNPLAPIANASQLLALQKNEDPLQQQARMIIDRQVGHLNHLVDDLLEVSRITSGRIHLNYERITLKDIIDHSVETVHPLMDQRQHACQVSLPSEPIWMLADATRLKQVMTNLLTNAAKYMEDEGQIWLTVELANSGNEPPRECVIRVRDTGIGISAELLPHVFDLFTQAGQSLDRAQGGLGIGLALVERIVKLHGGSVTVSSTVGKGSEFVVRLPVVPSLAPKLRSPDTDTDQPTTRPLRVLVADDNRDMVSSVSMLLRALGHDARAAHDGLAVVPTAVDYHPDVVLLDIGLPALNGYEVAKQIRQEPTLKNIVLVALTGYGQEKDRQTALKAGFNHHLVKPACLEKLQQIFATVPDVPAR